MCGSSLRDFVELKAQRNACCEKYKCLTYITQGNYCGRCRSMRQKLCRDYHVYEHGCSPKDAMLEIVGRLKYEFVFDIIDMKSLKDGTWMKSKLRDIGHTQRLQKLYIIACGASYSDQYKWLLSKAKL